MSDLKLDLGKLNQELEQATPQEILQWAWQQFNPYIGATSSFQTQSVPLLHIIATSVPTIPIYFLDTGFHFPETLNFRDRLVAEFGLTMRLLRTEIGHDGFKQRYGQLHHQNPDLCCYINKVEPLRKAKQSLHAWISGIRRDQTAEREKTAIVSLDGQGQYKICPLATWTDKDVWRYINRHNLPVHPLLQDGYMSIGCAPCTRPVTDVEDTRAGRWSGQAKTECGLHTA